MQLHELKPTHSRKKGRRVGRGLTRGTFSGRGSKGQASRAGKTLRPIIRVLIKRYPKLRGYRFKSLQKKAATVDVVMLEKRLPEGVVNPEILQKHKLIRRIDGRAPAVKILGKTKLTKKFNIEGCQISKNAKESVIAAGGSVK